MAEPGDREGLAAELLTALGLLAAMIIGALWTGSAVVEGSPSGVVVRFVVSLAGAWYYLVLFRVARGRPALRGLRSTPTGG